jgi:hypothetical protein
MADKEFESEDPMQLVGTLMECDEEEIEEMGLTFVEEFARMRWPREEIMAIFANPHYRGPHTVYRAKGPAFISRLIDLVTGATTRFADSQETAKAVVAESSKQEGKGDA